MSDAQTIERGTYEIIRDRLLGHGKELAEKANQLNTNRLELFGGTEIQVLGNTRIRTEHNCVPRDIVAVGDRLLFGYNVFIGLKRETRIADVLALHRFAESEGGLTLEPVAAGSDGDFLDHPKFQEEFHELYRYYKATRLLQLRKAEGRLLAVFQIGEKVDDIKVFRWAIDPGEVVSYIDNRGERDHVFPSSHDFEWVATSRDDHIAGRHPHVSILDEVFVETVGGDLTVKVEDNTEDGEGIYQEPVDDHHQSLDDADVHYAKLGVLILIRVLPFRETTRRYLVFNTRTKAVDRIDNIGHACVQLPEDHGLIFPGGYYLQSGETKTFDAAVDGMEYMGMVRSPNGEDVLYVFHKRLDGSTILLPYNMIRKEVQNPLPCHGYSIFPDGRAVLFRSVSDDPTRVHPMQFWQTPFISDEHAADAPSTGSHLEKIGNRDLVRGISDCFSIKRMVDEQQPTRAKYEDLIAACTRALDAYYWLADADVGDLQTTVKEVHGTAEQIIDEFEKVEALKRDAKKVVQAAEAELTEQFRSLRPESWRTIDEYSQALAQLRSRRGHLITLQEVRYVDRVRLDELEAEIVERFDGLSKKAVDFLLDDEALEPYHERIRAIEARLGEIAKVSDTQPLRDEIEQISEGLDVLTEVVGSLEIDDATVRTRILEGISEVMAALNRVRALVTNKRQELLHKEGVAGFGVQFNLFSQSVTSAMGLADTPEKCDEQLSRLMLSLEELESRFSEFDEFLGELATKREEVYEAISAKKQTLVDQQQRRAGNLMAAAERILQGVTRRANTFGEADQLNAFFASDTMVQKLRDLSGKLRGLGDSVRADEVDSRIKSAREDAGRSLRDRQDIYEDGASVIRLGQHRFSVNTQALELTMVPRSGRMAYHLTGTDYYELIEDDEFEKTEGFWDQELVSETREVYRAEYLAAAILEDAELGRDGMSLTRLTEASLADGGLLALVRSCSQERYDEGYERGVHDHDTALILEKLLALHATADLLRFAARPRAFAAIFWARFDDPDIRATWQRQARNLARLRDRFAHSEAIGELAGELTTHMTAFFSHHDIAADDAELRIAGNYLFEELTRDPVRLVLSADATALLQGFRSHIEDDGRRKLEDDLAGFDEDVTRRFKTARAWVAAFLDKFEAENPERPIPRHALLETVVALLTETSLDREPSSATVAVDIAGLLGQHPRITNGNMTLRLDEFLARVGQFQHCHVPAYRRFQELRHEILERERKVLRLGEFEPRVLSSFVRNKLIDEVYLPLIGDNLAKQMGALGDAKRTDLMGMLLLISPPGYGKTTLMEYIANRLGLVFMKVNGPALGHSVTSLDPAEAPNATARKEVEKLNLAFEMGNNVLLYLDDIQHTHPEFLQKFISLCDAQRKVEGVWRGETRTYDLRGKKFAVCMAGNPYTESGERFQIPDMLANRADIYNLGDVLEGKDHLFALSYIENALTSNSVLAPLTTREPDDVYKLVAMAQGEEIQADQLAHDYSSVELHEVLQVLERLLVVQKTLLAINRQYIMSASQQDAYRTEPPFKLQGSYRNMNKLAEKTVAAMNETELQSLIGNHYVGEAQTLTAGAEENLLKLAELRSVMTDEQTARWDEIKRGFMRVQATGGGDDDPVARVTGQLSQLARHVEEIGLAIGKAGGNGHKAVAMAPYLERLDATLVAIRDKKSEIHMQGPPSINEHFMSTQAALIDATLIPLLRSMAHKLKDAKDVNDSRLEALLPKIEYIDTLGDLMEALDDIDDDVVHGIAREEDAKHPKPPVAARPVAAKPVATGTGNGGKPPKGS